MSSILSFLLQLIAREGRIAPDWDDEIVQGAANFDEAVGRICFPARGA